MENNVRDGGVQDVCIVGGGPVGMFTAMMLANNGVKVSLFEKSDKLYHAPRAVNFAPDIVRANRLLGKHELSKLIEHIHSGGIIIYNDFPHKPTTQKLLDTSTHEYMEEMLERMIPFGNMSTFHQPTVESWWRDRLEELESSTVYTSCTVLKIFPADGDNLTKVLVDTKEGDLVQFKCKYLFCADGGKSGCRKGLGIKYEGPKCALGYRQECCVLDTQISPELLRRADYRHLDKSFFCSSPDRTGVMIILPGKGRIRVEYTLKEGETAKDFDDPKKVNELLREWGLKSADREHVKILRQVVYRFHSSVAEFWKVGNVFLGGDAAHCQPPWQGQGLCSGIRDALNLGWKISWVVKGKASANILETYQSERYANQIHVIESNMKMGNFLNNTSWFFNKTRDNMLYMLNSMLPVMQRLPSFNALLFGSLHAKVIGKIAGKSPDIYISDGILSQISAEGPAKAVHGTFLPGPTVNVVCREMPGDAFTPPIKEDTNIPLDFTLGAHNFTVLWIAPMCDHYNLEECFSKESINYLKSVNTRFTLVLQKAPSEDSFFSCDVPTHVAGRDIETDFDLCVQDVNGYLTKWSEEHTAELIIVRPDMYMYAVTPHAQADAVVSELKFDLNERVYAHKTMSDLPEEVDLDLEPGRERNLSDYSGVTSEVKDPRGRMSSQYIPSKPESNEIAPPQSNGIAPPHSNGAPVSAT
ncbi:hypothetical protein CYMTET_51985 [Cymbomonas tetramitiformis]|uniref:FAD-binding domain-containing protein n=1 Tax=Cymbomonas tetramitiformis TaxID=36881 RepID=A0AAE0BK16_9CHLO|nr:hypothetical protein CYMTET_51985 [Cymbomonas tetramitiformis]